MESRINEPAIEAIQRRLKSKSVHLAVKRILDIVAALALSILTSPVFIVVAILIRASSPGPVFYRQPRIGYRGSVFHMLKFRSMHANSDLPPQAKQALGPGDVIKMRDDPRVTAVGKIIRRYSIDELPQLLNVINGQMSLVGPRPLPLAMGEPYENFIKARSLLRPGITGLFQLRDRDKGQNAKYMIPSDMEYLLRFDIWLDMRILLKTPIAVLSGKGAY